MPDRINAWGVFDLFETADGEQVFLGVVTDTQWAVFGRAFDLGGLADDPRSATNTLRVQSRAWMLPALREIIKRTFGCGLQAVFEREGLPYAPIVRPEQLYDDPHLLASGGLADLTLETERRRRCRCLPLLLDGRHLKPRMPIRKRGAQWRVRNCQASWNAGTAFEPVKRCGALGAASRYCPRYIPPSISSSTPII
jgi:crotonobetainyl-CoA:carnitine CoA-transferase CaiB-like acyl-CoA transferase